VERHPGYVLAEEVLTAHAGYRGDAVVALGLRLMHGGRLTPKDLGDARAARAADPQLLKRLWHCMAAFGRVREAEPC
jgi:hypothetical protein